ncbi:hypothetical protein KS670_003366 [Vibrio parahaemolyticus]|uniref:hypothetical protein n=1 Tax=Vibrio sp. B183 TaxID=1526762 RepID=UPI0005062450|nr:hypothetical protein [Vibrio sp. B183]EHR0227806.1 hypothetical protein [Vibrio parahaemolyticus]KFI12684.1 hypothetical protein IX95_06950 [Vibrio sp. B183]
MKEIKIIKKNRANFRISFDRTEADLVIDENTQNFEAGEVVKGYLVEVKQNSFKGRKPKFRKYTFSNEEPEVEIEGYAKLNLETWQFELHIKPNMKAPCKDRKMNWNPENLCWQTPDRHILSKAFRDLSVRFEVRYDDDYTENLKEFNRIEEEANKRSSEAEKTRIEDLEVHLTEKELTEVLIEVEMKKSLLNGKWWKSNYDQYKKYEVFNGGRFGTHDKVTKDGYIKQFQSLEYITRVCHAYNCKSVKDLLSKV